MFHPPDGSDPHPSFVHVTRPDGRLQVGVGPGAWLVEGWSPGSTSPHDPRTVILQGLLSGGPLGQPGAGHGPAIVSGECATADRLRRSLRARAGRAATEQETGDGSPGPSAVSTSRPGAVVLVSPYLVPVGTARRRDLRGRPVLPVVPQTDRVQVGPWTGVPDGPCLHCLDLRRTDGDSAWPMLAAMLDDPLTLPAPPRHGEQVLDLVDAIVTLLVTTPGSCDRGADPVSQLSYEVGARSPHLVTRRWNVHPACPFHGPGGQEPGRQ